MPMMMRAVQEISTRPMGREDRRVIVVCGAPRCGSSLMMRMLYLGGIDVVADLGYQSFEHSQCRIGPIAPAVMASAIGHAIKVLDPHVNALPDGFAYRILWLRRDVRQQARSMLKFLRDVAGVDVPSEPPARFVRKIEADRRYWRQRQWPRLSADVLEIWFERLLDSPARVAEVVSDFVGRPLDIEAMRGCVHPRSPKCLSYLLEAALAPAVRAGGAA